jgi:hypothetical protein
MNSQNHWISELCPSSGILNTRDTTFPKAGLFPSFVEMEDTCFVGSLRNTLSESPDAFSMGPNGEGVSLPSPEEGNRSTFRNIALRIPDDRQVLGI